MFTHATNHRPGKHHGPFLVCQLAALAFGLVLAPAAALGQPASGDHHGTTEHPAAAHGGPGAVHAGEEHPAPAGEEAHAATSESGEHAAGQGAHGGAVTQDTAAHGAQGHGGDAHGGDAHGGGHQVNHLDNWFSWSFGPGKKYNNGPLAFALLNFIILVWLVLKFARKPFRQYLEDRHQSIRKNLEEAAALNQQARARLGEIEGKLKNISREIAEIKESVAKDAAMEKDRIIKAAEAEAERIVAHADETMQKELHRARRKLEMETVDAAMAAAEKLIRTGVTDGDRQRLNEEYFAQIQSGGRN